jgi:hypothetical protein
MNPLFSMMNMGNLAQDNIKSIQPILSLLKTKNPSEALTMLQNSNPQFKEFYEANKNRKVEDVAKQYGIDMSLIKQLLNKL